MSEAENGTKTGAKTDSEAPSGGKSRSETAYPYFGLTHGIKLVEAVRRAGGNDAPSADVMRELNIEKVTDRLWSYGVPAAVQFGLVERVGRGDSGRIKVTPLGLRVVLPGPNEERAAKIAAFKTPELYTSLLTKFAGAPVPTKDGLKNILYREFGIVESMTTLAAEAFLDSLKVADLVTPGGLITTDAVDTPAPENTVKKTAETAIEAPAPRGMKSLLVPENFVIYKCKISGGRVIDIPLPPEFSQSDVKRLYAFLQTQVDDDDEKGGNVPSP
jgi:hypothetical protein